MVEIWIKPNGVEVPINPNSAEYARSLGWKPKLTPVEEEAPKRRGRPPKAD